MARVLISLGANLGNSYDTMLAASGMLTAAFGERNVRISRLYVTPPIGGPKGQSDFLNAVAEVDTPLSCWEVWDLVKRFEKDLGRERQIRWEARRLDLDLLLYEKLRIWTPHLKIPHPRMCMRSFVLVPALEIAPDMIDPVTGWTIERLNSNLLEASQLPISVYSNTLEASQALANAIPQGNSSTRAPKLRFVSCDFPDQIQYLRFEEDPRSVLRIFCVRTPEPETVQWEDFAYPWARALGLVENEPQPVALGPRYLLPDNDLSWTVQEIEASRLAMTCPMQLFER